MSEFYPEDLEDTAEIEHPEIPPPPAENPAHYVG